MVEAEWQPTDADNNEPEAAYKHTNDTSPSILGKIFEVIGIFAVVHCLDKFCAIHLDDVNRLAFFPIINPAFKKIPFLLYQPFVVV